MACACGKNKQGGSSKTYVHTTPEGKKTTYRTEVEAAAAAKRSGGSYRAQG
jgi:hypothetical protein